VSRKADFFFSLCMVALVIAAVVLGVLGARSQLA
jgi:hypothetical protein